MRRLWIWAAGLSVCLVIRTRALAEDLEVQTLKPPSPGDAQLLGAHTARQGARGALSLGVSLGYLDSPLIVVDPARGDRRVGALVGTQVSADVAAAYGVHERVEIGAALPVVLYQDTGRAGNIRPDDGVAGIGDGRLIARVRMLGDARSGFSLAARGELSLPTAAGVDFAGQPTVGFSPAVIAELRARALLLGANLGARLRKRTSVGDLDVGSAGFYALGAAVRLGGLPLFLLGEAAGEVAGSGTSRNPLELRGGARWDATPAFTLLGGYGRGVIGGYGAPDHRLLLTAAFRVISPAPEKSPAPRAAVAPPADPDPDRDGLLGSDDACPTDPEDFDGFEDGDGCPEADNDGDGIADAADGCRNHPEDFDSHDDGDGCPDPDNDFDGILDASDRCPNDAEIINGTDDDDGCPDEGRRLVVVGSTKIAIAEKLFFANNQDVILARSEPVLAQLAKTLQRMTWLKKVRIEGHTDDRGDAAHNKELSQRRASSVRKALLERGVSAERLEAVGYGEEQPVDSNRTLEGRANNRRVEFVILEQDPTPAGFKPPPDSTLTPPPPSSSKPAHNKESR